MEKSGFPETEGSIEHQAKSIERRPDSKVELEHASKLLLQTEKLMRRLLPNDRYLNQDAVYEILANELPERFIFNKVWVDYDFETGTEMFKKVTETLGKEYSRLLIEPSISSRLDEFLAFSKELLSTNNPKPRPAELRELFKKSFSQKMVYRTVAITEATLVNLKSKGFIADYYRKWDKNKILSNKNPDESMAHRIMHLSSRVNIHAGYANPQNSTLISVSDYPEMSQYAASAKLLKKWPKMKKAGYKLITIPIEINEFYLIRYGKYLTKKIAADAKGTWSSPQKNIAYQDPGIESFVEFQIPVKDIKFSERQEISPEQIPKFTYIPGKKPKGKLR